jgi:hypothetical protein
MDGLHEKSQKRVTLRISDDEDRKGRHLVEKVVINKDGNTFIRRYSLTREQVTDIIQKTQTNKNIILEIGSESGSSNLMSVNNTDTRWKPEAFGEKLNKDYTHPEYRWNTSSTPADAYKQTVSIKSGESKLKNMTTFEHANVQNHGGVVGYDSAQCGFSDYLSVGRGEPKNTPKGGGSGRPSPGPAAAPPQSNRFGQTSCIDS